MRLYEYIKAKMLAHPFSTVSDGKVTLTFPEFISLAEDKAEKIKNTCLKNHNLKKYGILCDSELETAINVIALICCKVTGVIMSKRYGKTHVNNIITSLHITDVITDNAVIKTEESKKYSSSGYTYEEKENLSNVAFIMCTSGTTGEPKGAMITYQNIMSNISDISKYFQIDSGDKIIISRPLYHCAVLTGEFILALIKGTSILICDDEFNPLKLIQKIYKYNVSTMCGTPTLFYLLAEFCGRKNKPLPLKNIAISGECMTDTVGKKLSETFHLAKIYHVYGLTEASPRVGYLRPEFFKDKPCLLSNFVPSLQARIVGNELQIKGPTVMKGYYENKVATDRAIEDGWLKTGDIVRKTKENMIQILCRKDNLIIRCGMNIYPAEIENAIKHDSRITEALAIGDKVGAVGEKIYLKVTGNISHDELYKACIKLLPAYEMPDKLEVVDEIKKNASGKIIRCGEEAVCK